MFYGPINTCVPSVRIVKTVTASSAHRLQARRMLHIPAPQPSLLFAMVTGTLSPLAITSVVPVALASKTPSRSVSALIPPVSVATSVSLLVASGIPPASGSTKGTKPRRNTHHRR
ncbi:hypothetical protein DFH29DRAFT_1078821 [Suillus ampliporus]|nr:hypothetical protein DFH29DRAFT_1078821 [Suillus ampliporus]